MSEKYYTPIFTQLKRPVRVYAGGRVVGEVRGAVFYKRLRAAHFLRTPPAIAFDLTSLDSAERAGAQWADIEAVDEGRHYRASLATIRQRGFELDRGFGRQLALPLAEWATGDEPPAEQLALPWGDR